MNKIFIVLFAAIAFFFGSEVATSVMASFDGDSEKIAYYLKDNINVMNYLDKELGYDGDITGIGRIEKLTVIDCVDFYDGYFIDFNEDEGYMVIADDYVLYDYQRNSVSPYEGIYAENYAYNTSTGYMYLTAEGDTLSTVEENNSEDIEESGSKNFIGMSDITQYLKENYKGYQSVFNICSSYRPSWTKSELTLYEKDGDDAENNCVLVSCYYCFEFMKHNGTLKNLPTNGSASLYDIWQLESITYQREVDLYRKKARCLNGGKVYIPDLYAQMRKYCNDNFCQVENLTEYEGMFLMDDIADEYGYEDLHVAYTMSWVLGLTEAMKKFHQGYPSMFRASISPWSKHTMCMIGYNKYEKKTKFLWWTYKTTAVLIRYINDEGGVNFFDMNRYYGEGCMSVVFEGEPYFKGITWYDIFD